jgi:drug/metabolite transporter (DMT)-like permease
MYEALLIGTMILNIIVDFIDRRTVVQGDRFALSLWTTIIQLLLILPLIGLVNPIPFQAVVLCAVVGAFSAFARIPWYRALATKRQTLSRLSPFVRLSSVISLLCAFLLLGEPFTYQKAGGGLLMVFGSLLITMDNPAENLKKFVEYNRAAGLALIFAASTAAIAVMYKYLLGKGVDLFSMYFYLKLFQLGSVLAVNLKGGALATSYRKIKHLRLLVVARLLQTIAALTYLLALSGLNLSVVEPIAALSPFLVLGIEFFNSRRAGENADHQVHWPRRVIMVRLISLVIVSLGLLMLYRGSA